MTYTFGSAIADKAFANDFLFYIGLFIVVFCLARLGVYWLLKVSKRRKIRSLWK
jgi:hypothetical protein